MTFFCAKKLAGFWRIFFWLAGGFLCAVGFAQPRLVIVQPTWDFGSVTNSVVLLHDFEIQNTGDAPLEIRRVVSSCNACLRAGVVTNRIAPGGKTLVRSLLYLRELSGEINRAILIDCNDPRNPSAVLELRGYVVPLFQIEPPEFDLDLSKGQQTAAVEIQPLCKLAADLSKVVCSDTNLVVKLTPGSAGGFEVAVTAGTGFPFGKTYANIIVSSTNSSDPPCQLTVWIHHPPDLELAPGQLTFQPQAEMQIRILWLKQHGVSHLTLVDAIPSADNYQCEIDPDANGLDYRINITTWNQQPMAGQTNSLTLQLVDAENQKKSVVVPLLVLKSE